MRAARECASATRSPPGRSRPGRPSRRGQAGAQPMQNSQTLRDFLLLRRRRRVGGRRGVGRRRRRVGRTVARGDPPPLFFVLQALLALALLLGSALAGGHRVGHGGLVGALAPGALPRHVGWAAAAIAAIARGRRSRWPKASRRGAEGARTRAAARSAAWRPPAWARSRTHPAAPCSPARRARADRRVERDQQDRVHTRAARARSRAAVEPGGGRLARRGAPRTRDRRAPLVVGLERGGAPELRVGVRGRGGGEVRRRGGGEGGRGVRRHGGLLRTSARPARSPRSPSSPAAQSLGASGPCPWPLPFQRPAGPGARPHLPSRGRRRRPRPTPASSSARARQRSTLGSSRTSGSGGAGGGEHGRAPLLPRLARGRRRLGSPSQPRSSSHASSSASADGASEARRRPAAAAAGRPSAAATTGGHRAAAPGRRESATPGIPALEARDHEQRDPDDGDKQNYDFHFVFLHSAS